MPGLSRLRWAHRLAVVLVVATLVLIVAGGLVTNTGAALAVPDWPTTFGHNMFLFPWSGMVGGVFYEHSHRLLGALVGALTVALAAMLWARDGRRPVRWLGIVAVLAVSLQGLLGGLRVLLVEDSLAVVHGALAQGFLGLTVVLALLTSRGWASPATPSPDPALRRLAVVTAAAVYLQIVAGAFLTHLGWFLLGHLAGAAALLALVPALGRRVARHHGDRAELRAPARALGILLGVQIVLGLGAYAVRFTGLWIPLAPASALALPVAHRLTGALLLAASLVLAFRAHRLAAVPARRPAEELVTQEVPA